MTNLTYRHLKSMCAKLSEKQLDQYVAVVDLDDCEVFEIKDFVADWTEGADPSLNWLPEQLDGNHPFLPFSRG
jgi:hypothetical protein